MSRRIVVFTVIGIVLLLLLAGRFYYGIQRDYWATNETSGRLAAEQAGLVKIDSVQTYNGEESYQIVTGSNAAGERLIVWLGGEEKLHVEPATAGISAEQAKAQLLQRSPNAELLRAVPGKLRNDYVWELFYKKPEGGSERYYYDYVKFSDGTRIDTWRLSLQ